MIKKRRLLFLSLTNDVGSERLPSEMERNGIECACLSPQGFYCALSRSIVHHFSLPPHNGMWLGALFVRSRLAKAVDQFRPDLLVPLDDAAAWLLRGLAVNRATAESLRELIVCSIGAPSGYAATCSRVELMRVAHRLGLCAPRSIEITDARSALETACRWGYPVVLKQEHSCGGHGVAIAHDPNQLNEALEKAAHARSQRNWLASSRISAKHWVWRRAGFSSAARNALLQAYVSGRPAMCTVLARNGEVLESLCFVAERIHPVPTGSSTMIRHVEHAGMQEAAARVTAALGCSGFVSFDFMLEPERDQAYLIEMNPRPIGSVHLGALFGRDLCAALARWLRSESGAPVAAKAEKNLVVALFPKELERDPESFKAGIPADILHDVPWRDRDVVEAYIRRLCEIHPKHRDEIRRQTTWLRDAENVGITHAKSAPGPGVAVETSFRCGRTI